MEIVLDGPAKNALGTELLEQLRSGLEEAGEEPVLLRGAGDAFSAGLNLREVVSLNHETMGSFLSLLQEVTYRIFQHPAPTVACVNGHAIAGGAVLARACDVAIATSDPTAKLGLNEVALGLRFPPRILEIMKHQIPVAAHSEVLLGAQLMSPQDARHLGLVDAVSDAPLAEAQRRLAVLGAHPRAAYAATKEDLHGKVGAPDPSSDARFLDQVIPAWTSDELRQRLRAFLGG